MLQRVQERINNHTVDVIRSKDPDGKQPLLFAHGLYVHPKCYRKLLARLDHTYDVHAPAVHGILPVTSIEEAAQIFVEYAEQHKLRHAIGAGHSTGGPILSHYADTLGLERLVLQNPVGPTGYTPDRFFTIGLKDYYANRIHPVRRYDALSAGVLVKMFTHPVVSRTITTDIGQYEYGDLSVEQPTLCLYAENDCFFTLDEKTLNQHYHNLTMQRIPATDEFPAFHGWPIFYPELAYTHMTPFLDIPRVDKVNARVENTVPVNTAKVGIGIAAVTLGTALVRRKLAKKHA